MASRYAITPADMRQAALTLHTGAGIANRLQTVDATTFIENAEVWAEDQVSEYLGIPLKAVPAPGSSTVPGTPTKLNYPREFILAITYFAVARMLQSEYFANEPNASQAGVWAEQIANQHITDFRSRTTVKVGSGRRRHPNPFMPPNIAPREEQKQSPGAFQ